MIFVGIDPGLSGAVAFINKREISLFDTPTFETVKNKKGKESVKYIHDEVGMAKILRDMIPRDAGKIKYHIYLESVHAMPGQGTVSMFNFGMGLGLWKGIIAALQIPHSLVTPQAWKKELKLLRADKDKARIRACKLYPQAAEQLSKKKHIGRADAILIAEYGRRTYEPSKKNL